MQVRNRLILRAKFGQAMAQAFLVGLIFRDLPFTQQSIQNRSGALFYVSFRDLLASVFLVFATFGNVTPTLLSPLVFATFGNVDPKP